MLCGYIVFDSVFCPAAPLYSGIHDAQAGNCRVSPQVQRSPKTQGTHPHVYRPHFSLNSGNVFHLTGTQFCFVFFLVLCSISLLLMHGSIASKKRVIEMPKYGGETKELSHPLKVFLVFSDKG